jgi:hypothetical protein
LPASTILTFHNESRSFRFAALNRKQLHFPKNRFTINSIVPFIIMHSAGTAFFLCRKIGGGPFSSVFWTRDDYCEGLIHSGALSWISKRSNDNHPDKGGVHERGR